MQVLIDGAVADLRKCDRSTCCLQNCIEKARQAGLKLSRLAVVLEGEIKESNWTIEAAGRLKDVFASYNVTFII